MRKHQHQEDLEEDVRGHVSHPLCTNQPARRFNSHNSHMTVEKPHTCFTFRTWKRAEKLLTREDNSLIFTPVPPRGNTNTLAQAQTYQEVLVQEVLVLHFPLLVQEVLWDQAAPGTPFLLWVQVGLLRKEAPVSAV